MDQGGIETGMESVEAKKMGFECLVLIRKMLSRQLTQDEIYLKFMDLNNKYPMEGHNPPLTKYQIVNFREVTVTKVSDSGVKYKEHLYPMNFSEAGEMYIRHRESQIPKEIPF